MKLVTKLQVNNITIEKSIDNNFNIITNKVKIKNKRSQSAINSKERLENKYSDAIEKSLTFETRKQNKKQKKFEFLANKNK